MAWLPGRRPRTPKHVTGDVVALELSPRTAKLAAAAQAPFRLERLHAVTLPEAEATDPAAAVTRLLERTGLSGRAVGLLFSRELFTLRRLELPSRDTQEIASMLDLQLGKLTPYPRADILSGWSVIGAQREGYTSVLLAIGRKAPMDAVLRALSGRGLTPEWIGVSTEGLEAWWARRAPPVPQAPAGGLTALIDVDVTGTDCALLHEGRLIFSHHVPVGQEHLTASDQARLRWVGEFVRLPRILLHEDVTGQIGRGVLTGMAASLGSLAEQLSSQWGVPVEVQESLAGGTASPEAARQAQEHPASYTALAGLLASGAAPRMDLIPPEAKVSQALRTRSRHLARLAGTVAVMLVFAAVLYIERILLWRGYVAQLEAKLATVERTSEETRQRQGLMREIRAWLSPAHSALEVLRAVAEASDPEITITQVSLADGKPVTIRGRAMSMPGAYTFSDRLKALGLFANVQARSVAKARGVQAVGWDFEILCDLEAS